MADAIERARAIECLAQEYEATAPAGKYAANDIRNGILGSENERTIRAMLAFAQQAPGMVLVPRDDLARIRTSMCMLQQNSEGCAVNHYGGDHELFGMPGWLTDTQRDVEALSAMLDASPSVGEGV